MIVTWVVDHIRSIMLVSGVLTATMLFAAVAPQAALRATFGTGLDGPAAEIVVRNWGVLIAAIGGLLIYGAWNPAVRPAAAAAAGVTKAAFLLLLVWGRDFIAGPAAVPFASDVVQVALLGTYLFAACTGRAAPR